MSNYTICQDCGVQLADIFDPQGMPICASCRNYRLYANKPFYARSYKTGNSVPLDSPVETGGCIPYNFVKEQRQLEKRVNMLEDELDQIRKITKAAGKASSEDVESLSTTAKTNADLLMEISNLEGRLEQIQAKALAKGCDCCALPKFNDEPGAGE